ncbi:MAG: methyltransferase domain-containing protein [Bacteroidetes bacterium]|nr:methyltransferase domain-containing protein [Bacteroidota bacterium]
MPEFIAHSDSYWSQRYQQNLTGWDIGAISTPLKEYIDQLDNKNQRILIPGCGNAYEAEYLLNNGFKNVTLVDISEVLIKQLKKKFYPKYEEELTIIHGNFFDLNDQFDLVIEQTFFCALEPEFRPDYAKKMHQLIKPNGKLVGVMFNREFEHNGPPFGGHAEEYEGYFNEGFSMKYFTECYNSIPPRLGNELFVCLVRN